MPPNAPVKVLPSSAYIDDYWNNLTDADLMQIPWYIDDPRILNNIENSIPSDLGEFQIEIEYKLDHGDKPVPCAHCPQHTPHWHGFVLKTPEGNRYLLGSVCGPKAYGSDYRMASGARTRKKRRHDILQKWIAIREKLPDFIDALAEVEQSDSFKAVRRVRARAQRLAPILLSRLFAVHPNSLTQRRELHVSFRERDLEAEKKADDAFQAEIAAIAHLTTKQHRLAHEAIRQRLNPGNPIWVHHSRNLGELAPIDWLSSTDLPEQVEDVTARLRGYHALGQLTEGKANSVVEKLSGAAEKDLETVIRAMAKIRLANQIFEPENLRRIVEWDQRHHAGPVGISAAGSELHLPRGEVLSLGADWSPPGALFQELAEAYRPTKP